MRETGDRVAVIGFSLLPPGVSASLSLFRDSSLTVSGESPAGVRVSVDQEENGLIADAVTVESSYRREER